MSFPRLLALIALVGGSVHFWSQYRDQQAIAAVGNSSGFVPVPMPDGAEPNKVLVFAPLNCPKEGAQRARALAQELTARGIPNALTNRYSLAAFRPTPEMNAAVKRLNAVMTGTLPIVLVNGMGKANPSAAEVAAQLAVSGER